MTTSRIIENIHKCCEKLDGRFESVKTADCFRALRNKCAADKSFQLEAGSVPALIENTFRILRKLSASFQPNDVVCFRVGIQFLGNFIVGSARNQEMLWNQYLTDVLNFATSNDSKARNYMAMTIHNLILNNPTRSDKLLSNRKLITALITDAGDESEFSLFVLETFMKQGYFRRMYDEALDCQERLLLLEVVQWKIADGKKLINEHDISYLSDHFKRKSDRILKTVSCYLEGLEPEEVTKLLSVLCSISSSEPYLKQLQQDKSLFINCTFLLRSIHTFGKQGSNQFTIDDRTVIPTEEMIQQPTFGFKADIIRLIGNLMYRNPELQNMIRDLEGIPVLLDCCKIDAKNPYILQWSILAIRNLCESNADNQSVIASTAKIEEIDSNVVSQLGLTLHTEGDKTVNLIPIQKK